MNSSARASTLALLWQEYKTEHPGGVQYTQFCERYRLWSKQLDVVMRQSHRAGEKLFLGSRLFGERSMSSYENQFVSPSPWTVVREDDGALGIFTEGSTSFSLWASTRSMQTASPTGTPRRDSGACVD